MSQHTKPTTKHEDALKEDLQKSQLQGPSGATQAEQQRETDAAREAAQNQPTPLVPGKPAKAADAPILANYEGETYATVTLIGGGSGDGVYRVRTPLPQAVASNGERYLKSTADTYAWQVK
jgi:hypothetical protein